MPRFFILVAVVLALVISLASGEIANKTPLLEALLRHEQQLIQKIGKNPNRGRVDSFGTDPFKIHYLPVRQQYLILFRNPSQVWLTDGALNPLDRAGTPKSPTGWTLVQNRFLFIAGELASEVQVFEVTGKGFIRRTKIQVHGVASIRDLVYVPSSRSLFLLDEFDGRLVQATLPVDWPTQKRITPQIKFYPLGAGPLQIRHEGNHLLINLLLEHTLLVVPVSQGQPEFSRSSRITHNGPIWGFDLVAESDSLIIAATGVENRPLNRLGGEFGYIDSFLYLYTVALRNGVYRWSSKDRENPEHFSQINLSEINVITPKAVRLIMESKHSYSLWVAGFGSTKMARFNLSKGKARLSRTYDVPPGTTDFVMAPANGSSSTGTNHETRMILTNSLLDGVYGVKLGVGDSSYEQLVETPHDTSKLTWQSRVGELLFFTNLLTPNNRSEGELSRFTCEACHYEGNMDGRVHYTGREHVFASTKPLRGLANNVPLFSRAGDKSLSAMVLAEFKVANQKRHDSFSIHTSKHSWLEGIDGLPKVLSPPDLRMAFLSFFVEYTHRPNPWRLRSQKLTAKAQHGLAVFRDRCEYCHQAIVSTRQPESIPFSEWGGWLETDGKDLVWGAPFYTKTGIRPYVHRAGARVPSLRRVQQKHPYFTNGSSPTLGHLLARFRYRELTAWHHYEETSEKGSVEEVKALTRDEIESLKELLRFY